MKKEQILQMKSISDEIPTSLDISLHMCGTTYPHRSYVIRRPDSPVSCIEYVLRGGGEVHIDGQTFYPRAGDTYFLPQGKDHYYFSDKKDPWEKVWVNFSGARFLEQLESCGLAGRYHFPALDTSDLLTKMQSYASHPEASNAAEKCSALLSQLLFRMVQSHSPAGTRPLNEVEKMLLYIEQHETESIRIEQLAQVCGKSQSQAERLFRAKTGMPIYRYVLERKLELARQLLTETGMSVREIASFLSFEDEFYFSGLFRRKVGLSPAKYRAQVGKKP